MATIRQIEDRTVHQIQSGQVIVDLCSVVKELVENSIDAGATNIDVRFKNQGLELVEIQDNGSGISPANYASVALKHHTSKLSSYSDIATLETFGFRGEALASLCALSILSITTCQASEVPKGSRLAFETSGKLKGTAVVATQRGTTVSVEKLFHNLPVRRRELERNIKREWHKVIALLNQYACIQTGLKFSVSQQPTKGKRVLLFSTKGNPTTRENIINIFGAKSMTALVPLDLRLEMSPSAVGQGVQAILHPQDVSIPNEVHIIGHVSRPTHGEGRQTPDRQMFFVNGRPCGMPQFAKVFNEVYRSYNSSQTPFILADIQLDTHMYDVNVSPDKRSILLHDQNNLLDSLRSSLMDLFDSHDYVVPTSQLLVSKQDSVDKPRSSTPAAKNGTNFRTRESTKTSVDADTDVEDGEEEDALSDRNIPSGRARTISSSRSLSKDSRGQNLISRWVERKSEARTMHKTRDPPPSREKDSSNNVTTEQTDVDTEASEQDIRSFSQAAATTPAENDDGKPRPVKDFNARLAEHGKTSSVLPSTTSILFSPSSSSSSTSDHVEPPIPAVKHLRPNPEGLQSYSHSHFLKRSAPEVATITIGDQTITSMLGSSPKRLREAAPASNSDSVEAARDDSTPSFRHRSFHTVSASTNPLHLPAKEDEHWTSPSEDDDEEDSRALDHSNIESDNASEMESYASEEPEAAGNPPSPTPQEVTSRGLEDEAGREQHDDRALVEVSPSTITKSRPEPFKSNWRRKDATYPAVQHLRLDEGLIGTRMNAWIENAPSRGRPISNEQIVADINACDAEEKLSLIISKTDFARMRIAGQFNMGFIIATRLAQRQSDETAEAQCDELFIIDQHATDEKYNFERLQDNTVLQSQRLVHPKRLELTALEEEIVMQNMTAIEANGFKIDIDTSGNEPVGSRCQLLALPLSRETTFDLKDLEELISLLGDESSESKHIPRPSRVRKMFAMRACRSSIMIGKALTHGQMEKLVRHMGELDKPWNCPHGRPTMRHLCRLQSWDDMGWKGDLEYDSGARWRSYALDE